MCALAMMCIATQAQDEVYCDISNTPATEVVEGHIYLLANRAYPEIGLVYDSNEGSATTFEPVSEQLGQSVTSNQPFLFTATADGFTLPVTLQNINDVNIDWGYGETGGGIVLSPRRGAAASEETVYFTVKVEADQLVMLYNGTLYGVNATTPAESAQWIAYEVKEHEHKWAPNEDRTHYCTVCYVEEEHSYVDGVCEICQHECRHSSYIDGVCEYCGAECEHKNGWEFNEEDDYWHYCIVCYHQEHHHIAEEGGTCVCGFECPGHEFFFDSEVSISASNETTGEYVMHFECVFCQYQKTETVDPDADCPNGDQHSWDVWVEKPTCTMRGYTYHQCISCDLMYISDFTDIDRKNHNWQADNDYHWCGNGCELYGQDQEHNMVDDKCTICGYWPGHTEHKWETDEYGHYCSIPGCEDYQDRQEHEIDENCTCTVCGYTCHEWNNGVCEICQVTCSHDHKYLVKGYEADCISDGWKEHYECEYCNVLLNDAGQPITDEEYDLYIITATGHLVNNEGICSVCENQITVADEFKWGESKSFEFYPASDMVFQDPMSYPLYQLIIKEGMVTQIDLPEDVDSFVEPTEESDGFERRWMLYPCASEEGCTRVGVGTDMLFNEPYNLTPGTYYMAPIMMSGWNEEVANVELTFPAVIAPCVDEEGNVTSVELTATTEGYAADADATVEIADGVSFTTPVDFTATGSQVIIDREFTQNTPATINLPFDVDASVMGEKYYTFGGIALNAVTGKWEATMNEAAGTLLANTPYIVLPEGTTLGISNTATVTFRADASANSITASGDWKMVSSVAKKVWTADENADEIGKTYGFAGKSLTNADGVAIEAGQFVKVVAGAWIPAGRAYLTYKDGSDPTAASHAPALTGDAALPASISVRFVNADGTNGIGTLDTESGHMTIDAWYDLQGRRISEPKQGGIYIRNNKKITVK